MAQYRVYAVPSNAAAPSLQFIGQNFSNNFEWWSGDLVRLLVYNQPHSTAQRQAVERGLGSLYGISVP